MNHNNYKRNYGFILFQDDKKLYKCTNIQIQLGVIISLGQV